MATHRVISSVFEASAVFASPNDKEVNLEKEGEQDHSYSPGHYPDHQPVGLFRVGGTWKLKKRMIMRKPSNSAISHLFKDMFNWTLKWQVCLVINSFRKRLVAIRQQIEVGFKSQALSLLAAVTGLIWFSTPRPLNLATSFQPEFLIRFWFFSSWWTLRPAGYSERSKRSPWTHLL